MLDIVGLLLDLFAGVQHPLTLFGKGGDDQAGRAVSAGERLGVTRIRYQGCGHLGALGRINAELTHRGDEGGLLQGDDGRIGGDAPLHLLGLIGFRAAQAGLDRGPVGKGGADAGRPVHVNDIDAGGVHHADRKPDGGRLRCARDCGVR